MANIDFTINKNDRYKIQILNTLGQEVNELSNKEYDSGSHKLIWNGIDNFGKQVSTGLYFVKISNNKLSKQEKIILMK